VQNHTQKPAQQAAPKSTKKSPLPFALEDLLARLAPLRESNEAPKQVRAKFEAILRDPAFKGAAKTAEYWIARASFEEKIQNWNQVIRVFENAAQHNAQVSEKFFSIIFLSNFLFEHLTDQFLLFSCFLSLACI
jgi:hypothetical protein